tara:strand:+ start:846 stop:1367 length:522 start_codon:yes stop_codon:yes gene_type:complete
MKLTLPKSFIPLFRTNHAGETGAVYIYKAILLVSKDKDVVDFSKKHLKTESDHLSIIEEILEEGDRSKLIFLWKIAGFLTGFIPSFLGKNFIFATIFYVESFVEKHYQDQIDMIDKNKEFLELKNLIKKLQEDEVSHKNEAFFEATNFNKFQKTWGKFIEYGSSIAVSISKKI